MTLAGAALAASSQGHPHQRALVPLVWSTIQAWQVHAAMPAAAVPARCSSRRQALTFVFEAPDDIGGGHRGPVRGKPVVELQHVLWGVHPGRLVQGNVREVQGLQKIVLHVLEQSVEIDTILLREDLIEEGHVLLQGRVLQAEDGAASHKGTQEGEDSPQREENYRIHVCAGAPSALHQLWRSEGLSGGFIPWVVRCLCHREMTSLEALVLKLVICPACLPLPPPQNQVSVIGYGLLPAVVALPLLSAGVEAAQQPRCYLAIPFP